MVIKMKEVGAAPLPIDLMYLICRISRIDSNCIAVALVGDEYFVADIFDKTVRVYRVDGGVLVRDVVKHFRCGTCGSFHFTNVYFLVQGRAGTRVYRLFVGSIENSDDTLSLILDGTILRECYGAELVATL